MNKAVDEYTGNDLNAAIDHAQKNGDGNYRMYISQY